jgi:hypothetical protein
VGPHVSLLVFLALYFLFLWVSWVLAVWGYEAEIIPAKSVATEGHPSLFAPILLRLALQSSLRQNRDERGLANCKRLAAEVVADEFR